MAQTIKLKRSAVQGVIPTTSQLELGEVAINTYDGKMYIKKNVGGTESIVEVGSTATFLPAGSDGQLQFNNGGALGATAQVYYDDINNRLGIGTSTPSTSLHVDGTITTDAVQFDTAAAVTPAVGQLSWNAAAGTLDLGINNDVVLQVGQETHIHVKAAEAISDGDVVYASGAVGNSGQIEVSKFQATSSFDPERVVGIATQDIAVGEFGYITTFGTVRGISTDGSALTTPEVWVDGTILYASPNVPGELTKTLPTAPNPKIALAFVTSAHATNGSIAVRAYDLGVHLHDVHDVHIASVANNDIIAWNSTNSRWENTDIPALVDARYVNVTGDTMTGDLIISKENAKLRLYEPNSATGNYPSLEFDTANNQGLSITFNEFDGELPAAGYGLVVGPSTTNNQHPTTGDISFNVLGEIYTGGETLSTLNKVWHAGNLTPSDYLLVSNYVDDYVSSAAFNTSNGVLTLTRNQGGTVTVDLDGRYYNTADSDSRYVNVTGDTMTGALNIQQGAGGQGLRIDTTSNWSSGTLYTPGLLFREQDGSVVGAIRGMVDATGANNLILGTGWLDQEVFISSSKVRLSQDLEVVGSISAVNTTLSGYLRGPANFVIDPAAHGDDTGTVVIAGNLQVDGTTTTINSTTLTVDDKNITLASGAANAAEASGAGITVDGAGAQLTYDATQNRWNMNRGLELLGTPLVVGTGATDVGRVENSSGVFSLTAYTGRQIAFGNDTNGEHVRIDADGKVGIDTSTPSAKLHIRNDAGSSTDSLAHLLLTGGNGGNNTIFKVDYNQDAGRMYLGYAGLTSDYIFFNGGTSSAGSSMALYNNGSASVLFNSNGSSYFNSGNVGFGVTSPSYKIHSSGTIYSATDVRAPIFYDSNNTGYYVDPASTTRLYKLEAFGTYSDSTYFAQGNYVEFSNTYLSRMAGNEMLWADRWATVTTSGSITTPYNVFRTGDNFAYFSSTTGTDNPVQWTIEDISPSATTNVSARRVVIFAHNGFSCDLIIEVKNSAGTWETCYNGSYSFSGARWHHFALTNIEYPADWPIRGIRVSIDNYGTSNRYIGQIGLTNTRDYNTFPYISQGGGQLYDNSELRFGNGNDLKIYHDGSNSNIHDAGTGNLNIRANDLWLANQDFTQGYIHGVAGGTTEVFYAGDKKLATFSGGVSVTGTVVSDGLSIGDGDVANFGSSNDLQIYHDGSTSYIQDVGTGDLVLRSSTRVRFEGVDTGETYMRLNENGAVQLYYDNIQRLATTPTGVDVTGTVVSDGLTVDGSVDINGNITVSGGLTFDGPAVYNAINLNNNSVIGVNNISFADPGPSEGLSWTNIKIYESPDDLTTNSSGNLQVVYGNTRRLTVNNTGIDVNGEISSGNITTTGYLRGPSNFVIDPAAHGDNTGTVVIAGNLQVDGTTTTINSTTVQVDDKNIELAVGSTNKAAADGAGITIDCGTDTDATIIYDGVNDWWELNKPLEATRFLQTGSVASNFYAIQLSRSGTGTTTPDLWGTNNTLVIGNSASNAVISIDASGRVNIGNPTNFSNANADDVQIGNTTGSHGLTIVSDRQSVSAIYFGDNDNNDAGNINYDHSVNRMRFYTNRSEKMVINSAGNVGIGTTAPVTPLQVHRVGAASYIQVTNDITGSTSSDGMTLGVNAVGQGVVYNRSNTDIRIGTNDTDRMIVNADGKVGIGIGNSTAGAQLHIRRNGADFGGPGQLLIENTTTSGEASIAYKNQETGTNYWFTGTNQDNEFAISYGSAFQDDKIKVNVLSTGEFSIGTNVPYTTGGTAKTTIVSSGVALAFGATNTDMSYIRRQGAGSVCWQTFNASNSGSIQLQPYGGEVAIGTVTPSSVFHVNTKSGTGNANTVFIDRPSSTDYSGVSFATAGTVDWSIGHNSNQGFMIFENGAAATTRFTIKDGGNVGIGDTLPQARLQVNQSGVSAGLQIARSDMTSGNFSTTNVSIVFGDEIVGTNIRHQASINAVREAWTNSPTALTFKTASAVNAATEKMRVTSAGSVGIGTPTPITKLDVAGDVRVNSTFALNGQEATLATTTQTQIASFSATTYGGGKFVITAKDGVNRHICELLVVHDGTTASATQYGSVFTSGELATYDVDISGGNVRILATSASANSTEYKVAETLMEA